MPFFCRYPANRVPPAYRLQDKTRSRVCYHTLPHVPRPQTSPPYQGGLLCCHVSLSPGPRLPANEGSSAATCPTAPDLASLSRRAPVLPRVLSSGSHLPAEEGSGVPMRPATLDPESLPRRALTPPCVQRLFVGCGPQV
jgi:hypothetical protein